AAWDACGNGTIVVCFYANDTMGNTAFREVIVRKNTHFPVISINSPTPYQLFGNATVDFDLTINDPNLNTTWYSLNDGLNYMFLGTSGTIEKTAWNACGNGTVSIKFYANNTAGNIAFKEVIVRKDTHFPELTIITPKQSQLFGNSTIDFDLIIDDPDLNTTWYSLNNGLNYTFSGTSGAIEKAAWDACGNGTISIKFYANNTAGNIAFIEVIVLKDVITPDITINLPIPYQLFGNATIDFDLFIKEANLNTTWYSLNDGLNYTFSGTSGTIEKAAWDACGNGTIVVCFYANDTMGNTAFKELIVRKDIHLPEILIFHPVPFQLFGNATLTFKLSIVSMTLNTTWYTLNDGLNYIFLGTSGTIEKAAWDACGNGMVSIKFYANNSAGNVAFKEILVNKDTKIPIIIINYPFPKQIFANKSINFDLFINEPNLNTTWYSLNDGLNYTFSGTSGTINETAWDACGYGIVIVRFYANDTMGNMAFKEIINFKCESLTGNIFIAYEWNRTWDGQNMDFAYDVAIDSFNDIYIVGVVNFVGSDEDVAIVKYNSLGEFQWYRIWDGGTSVEANGICINKYDEIFITGEISTYISGIFDDDLFILKYDRWGSLKWTRIWGGSGYKDDYGLDIASDSAGNIYVVGGTYSYGEGNNDMVIINYDRNGSFKWMKTYGTAYFDWAISISIDSSNNIYVVGTIDTPSYDHNMCILKYDITGTLLWDSSWGLEDNDYGTGVAVDSNGNIYVVGEGGGAEVFLIKYDSGGQEQWNLRWCEKYLTSGVGISIDSYNNIFITGFTNEFGQYKGFYIVKYNSSGTQLGYLLWGLADTESFGITIDSLNNVYLVGCKVNVNYDFCLVKFGLDSDNDKLTDWQEVNLYFTDPYNPDSDDDDLNDWEEINPQFPRRNPQPTDPNDPDSDDDGLNDGEEYYGIRNPFGNSWTNPNDSDSDDDGLSDYEEIFGTNNTAFGNEPTNPNEEDTDNDGWFDGDEVNFNTDPNDPNSYPYKDDDNDNGNGNGGGENRGDDGDDEIHDDGKSFEASYEVIIIIGIVSIAGVLSVISIAIYIRKKSGRIIK
ncbi:MAG: SBBP repeat-containing protein, partial [Promethearchaeota archaeon]